MFLDLASIQNNIIGQFVLPFALLFAISYGSLRTAGVFSNSKNVDMIIAGVIAFIAALFSEVNAAIFEFMPVIIAILVALFLYNIFYTLLTGETPKEAAKNQQQQKQPKDDVVLVIGALLVILALKGRDFVPDLRMVDQTNLIFIFALLGIFLIWRRGWGKKTPP